MIMENELNNTMICVNQNVGLLEEEDLVKLWTSVGWVNGSLKYPERLLKAMQKTENIWLAWNPDHELVGLLSAMDDGYNAYISYFVVHKDFQGWGIGKRLLKAFCEKYENYRWQVVTTKAHNFYEKFGFKENSHGMTRNHIE